MSTITTEKLIVQLIEAKAQAAMAEGLLRKVARLEKLIGQKDSEIGALKYRLLMIEIEKIDRKKKCGCK